MKNAIGSGRWLLVLLLVILVGNLTAQVPQSGEISEQAKAKPPALLAAVPLKEDANDSDLRKLLKARYNEATCEMKLVVVGYNAGLESFSFDMVIEAAQRLVRAGLEVYDKPAEKVALLTQYVELVKESEQGVSARYDIGRVSLIEVHRARYLRLDAEILLLRAQQLSNKADNR